MYGYYAGLLDEVTVYNRVLSDQEIAAICIAEAQGKCTSPLPAIIVNAPDDSAINPESSTTLTVNATGTPPLAYQWYHNGSPIPGETGETLFVDKQHIGLQTFRVGVSNILGEVLSRSITLTVRDTQCVSQPAGARSWWRGEHNANDTLADRHGTPQGGAGFAAGKVGQAFAFNGSNAWVDLPDGMYRDIADTFTLECWARPEASRATTTEINTGVEALFGQAFALLPEFGGTDACAGLSLGTNGISVVEHGGDYMPSLLVYDTPIADWVHIAVVYQDKQPSLYLNGRHVRTGLRSLRPSVYPSFDLSGSTGYYQGLLDEVSIYDRALSSEEIAAIYVSDTLGKCTTQPAFHLAFEGYASGDQFRLTGGNGLPYLIQYSTNLTAWQTIATNAGSIGPLYYVAPADLSDQNNPYYYRARRMTE